MNTKRLTNSEIFAPYMVLLLEIKEWNIHTIILANHDLTERVHIGEIVSDTLTILLDDNREEIKAKSFEDARSILATLGHFGELDDLIERARE